MKGKVELTTDRIRPASREVGTRSVGAWLEFSGVVRGEEAGQRIEALEYEAYDEMARRVLADLLQELGTTHRCAYAHVIHRTGIIPVGETAIWMAVGAGHRKQALAFVTEFMDRLKEDVPIWKRRALTAEQLNTIQQRTRCNR